MSVSHAKIKNTDSESAQWGFNVLYSFCKHDFMASCFEMSMEAKYFALNFKVVNSHGKHVFLSGFFILPVASLKEIKKELMDQF